MTHEQLLALIDERAAADPVFAADVAERRDALLAMAHEPDPIDVKSVSDALNRREKEQQA